MGNKFLRFSFLCLFGPFLCVSLIFFLFKLISLVLFFFCWIQSEVFPFFFCVFLQFFSVVFLLFLSFSFYFHCFSLFFCFLLFLIMHSFFFFFYFACRCGIVFFNCANRFLKMSGSYGVLDSNTKNKQSKRKNNWIKTKKDWKRRCFPYVVLFRFSCWFHFFCIGSFSLRGIKLSWSFNFFLSFCLSKDLEVTVSVSFFVLIFFFHTCNDLR